MVRLDNYHFFSYVMEPTYESLILRLGKFTSHQKEAMKKYEKKPHIHIKEMAEYQRSPRHHSV